MSRIDRIRQLEARAKVSRTQRIPREYSEWRNCLRKNAADSADLKPGTHWSNWAWSRAEMEQRLGRLPTSADPVWKEPYTGPTFPGVEESLRFEAIFAAAFRNKAMQTDEYSPPLREQLSSALAERLRLSEAAWTADRNSVGAPDTFAFMQKEWLAEDEWQKTRGCSRIHVTHEEHARFLVAHYLGETPAD